MLNPGLSAYIRCAVGLQDVRLCNRQGLCVLPVNYRLADFRSCHPAYQPLHMFRRIVLRHRDLQPEVFLPCRSHVGFPFKPPELQFRVPCLRFQTPDSRSRNRGVQRFPIQLIPKKLSLKMGFRALRILLRHAEFRDKAIVVRALILCRNQDGMRGIQPFRLICKRKAGKQPLADFLLLFLPKLAHIDAGCGIGPEIAGRYAQKVYGFSPAFIGSLRRQCISMLVLSHGKCTVPYRIRLPLCKPGLQLGLTLLLVFFLHIMPGREFGKPP